MSTEHDHFENRCEESDTSDYGSIHPSPGHHALGQDSDDIIPVLLETSAHIGDTCTTADFSADNRLAYELKSKGRTAFCHPIKKVTREELHSTLTTVRQNQETIMSTMNSLQQHQDKIAYDVKTLVRNQKRTDKQYEETIRRIAALHKEPFMRRSAVEDIPDITQKQLQKDVQADQHIQPNDLEQQKIVTNRGQKRKRRKTLFDDQEHKDHERSNDKKSRTDYSLKLFDDDKDDNNEKDKNQSEDKEKSRSQYETKCLSPWKIDQEAWRHNTESKTLEEFTEKGQRLLTESKIPNDNLLGIIFEKFRGKEIVKEICDAVCEYIKQTNENIIEVWAGYEYKNNTTIGYKVIFVIITKGSQDITNNDFTVICRGFYEISSKDENLELLRRERENPPEYKKLQLAKQALRKCAPALMEKHKKLTRATISWMKGTIGKPLTSGIQKCMCIALYVQVRGVVPIDEEPFPKQVEELPVDVREGLVKPCKGPYEHHKHLKTGCAILGSAFIGTLGPFLKFQNRENEQYVLTCAHVLFQGEILKQILEENAKSWTGQKVYQPGTTGPDEKEFGEVVLVKHKKGRNGLAGMELALIKVHERHPTAGKFPDAPNYADAGFGPEKPFIFTSGEVLPVSALKTDCVVFKYGCETQLTKGEIHVNESSIRIRAFTSKNVGVELILNGQIEVVSSANMCFARTGDSGALVLAVSESTGQLAAVGMLEGEAVDGTCFLVTPLVDILNELATQAGSDCYLNTYPQCQTLHHTKVEDPLMDTTENDFVPLTSRFEELDNKVDLLKQSFDIHKTEIKHELTNLRSQVSKDTTEVLARQRTAIKEDITQMLEQVLQSGNNLNRNSQI